MSRKHSPTSVWLQLTWTTLGAEPVLLNAPLKRDIFNVIRNVSTRLRIYLDTITGYKDHVHVLIRLPNDQDVTHIIGRIKEESCEFFKRDPRRAIAWQNGFTAFTVHRDKIDKVRQMISDQDTIHPDTSLADELKAIKQEAGFYPPKIKRSVLSYLVPAHA